MNNVLLESSRNKNLGNSILNGFLNTNKDLLRLLEEAGESLLGHQCPV
jgi:hypothetical protein